VAIYGHGILPARALILSIRPARGLEALDGLGDALADARRSAP
jgi:hypothetical protein